MPCAPTGIGYIAAMAKHARSGVAAANPGSDPGWVALAEIVAKISRQVYHWPVRRKTFDLIVYFATESGVPTGLRYVLARGAPSFHEAGRLRENLLREVREGRTVAICPGPTYESAERICAANTDRWAEAIDRVADLFLRMRTQQAEVAAMVHFAALGLTREGQEKPTEAQVLEKVRRWKQRRRPPLKDSEVASAIRSLNILGWLKARPSLDLPLPKEALLDV